MLKFLGVIRKLTLVVKSNAASISLIEPIIVLIIYKFLKIK